jgi:uncharacterized phage protein (TIGR02218 family)
MKLATPATIALLAGNQFFIAELYTITLFGGTVLRYTDADGDLVYAGNIYSSTSPKVTRDKIKVTAGIQVDSMGVKLYAGISDLIQGIPFPQFCANGGFDGAKFKVERCFMPSYGDTSAGVINMFSGRVSDVKPSRTEIELAVVSDVELLDVVMPRNVYSVGCSHTLYSTGCGVLKASFATATTCLIGSSASTLLCGLAQTSAYFDGGTILFTSGQNAGATRTVKSYTPGVLNLSLPLPYPPAVGDAFTAFAGCDKQQATCSGKFNQLTHFRGFPYVPTPEASV